jgi:hypothetical protein
MDVRRTVVLNVSAAVERSTTMSVLTIYVSSTFIVCSAIIEDLMVRMSASGTVMSVTIPTGVLLIRPATMDGLRVLSFRSVASSFAYNFFAWPSMRVTIGTVVVSNVIPGILYMAISPA